MESQSSFSRPSSSNKKRPDRPRSSLDGKPAEEKVPYREQEEPLTQKQEERLFQRGMNSASWHLERAQKTSQEIREKLVKKDIPDSIIDSVIARLEDLHMLDDREYAETYTRSRTDGMRRGRNAVRFELRRKGVPAEIIDEKMDAVSDEDEEANARHLVKARLPRLMGIERQKATQRLVGMLARRGFSGSLAYRVIREEWEILHDEQLEELDEGANG